MRIATRSVWLALGLVVAAALGGCGQDQEPSASVGPASSEAQQEAESDFVSNVLADGEVTPAEVAEAKDRTVTCLADAGIEASYEPLDDSGQEGLIESGQVELTQSQISADAECHSKWMGGILELYNSRLVNPNDEDMEILTVDCLIRTGLAPESFTKNDLRELIERGSWGQALWTAQQREIDTNHPTLESFKTLFTSQLKAAEEYFANHPAGVQ